MYRRILLTGICLLALTGFSSAEIILNRGNDTDPATLDHHRTSTVSEGRIMADLYDGLLRQSSKGTAVPATAESWTISDDGTVYIFHLRHDAHWSNGDKVTAADFTFALRRIMNPMTAAGYASILFPIKNAEAVVSGKKPIETLGVKAIDETTLKITLERPTPYFLELLTH